MWARHRLEWVTAVLAAVLGVIYLVLPPMGSDLAAQEARAGFFAAHGYTPIDLRWYAGVDQLGYSLTSQPVMALLGVRVTGALALLASAVLFAVLLRRTDAPRPVLGSVIGTACIAGNLISGRVTYGLGVCLGLAALVALTTSRRTWLTPLLALLAAATSPVVALFLGLAGTALLLNTKRTGLLLALPATIPLALSALLFGDGGWMNISRTDTVRAVVAGLLVAALVPRRPVRIGALLSAAGVLAAALVHTPVGLNATRLAVMFTLPLLAAYATFPRSTRTPTWGVVLLVAAAGWWQPAVVTADVRDIGNPTADPAYFRPLRDRLAQERLTGRVEIPATRAYWEAAHMGDVPLARGWLRQADIDRNPLFFEHIPGARGTGVALTADSYRAWLDELAVQFVAVPDAELTWSGRPEAELVATGLPYLTEVWSDAHWRLYAVTDPRPIVTAPGTLVTQDAAALTFDAGTAGDVPVRIHWNRWLTVDNGASLSRQGDWIVVRIPRPGRYTVTSGS
ncbi:hypothetical protein KOI35_44830 [Actinoplanes bogorensis]|uniref:MFS transporter n=1 Tax=Paractinoplanes bogorensis TaxID=1610840 RepID=A0ABS5Z4N6_9ACTN|nr:hypothetical protein [Actinoplanes bogorensis]MBU2670649.1 hypothetical protein [Actinoplanes bogorensis]